MKRKTFYAALRRCGSGVCSTSVSRQRVDGMESIFDAFASAEPGLTENQIDEDWMVSKSPWETCVAQVWRVRNALYEQYS